MARVKDLRDLKFSSSVFRVGLEGVSGCIPRLNGEDVGREGTYKQRFGSSADIDIGEVRGADSHLAELGEGEFVRGKDSELSQRFQMCLDGEE